MLASEAGNAGARARSWRGAAPQGLDALRPPLADEGFLRNLVVREGRRTGELQVRLVTAPGRARRRERSPRPCRRRRPAVDADSTAWPRPRQGGETELLAGADRIDEEIGGLRSRISGEAFFQTNTEMAERLYGLAIEYAELAGFERVYDLYCGIGTIGLLMAPRAAELWGLEIVEEAIADAIANARLNEIDNAHFFAGDVRLALRELVEKAGRPDVLVVDPPRAGLSQKIVRRDHRGRAEADRLRLLQPDDARAERRAAGRGRLRAAPRCAPSTCSRRRRTSSASRSSSVALT